MLNPPSPRVLLIGPTAPPSRLERLLDQGGIHVAYRRPSEAAAPFDVIVLDLTDADAGDPIIAAAEELALHHNAPIIVIGLLEVYPLDRAFASPVYGYLSPEEAQRYLESEVRSVVKVAGHLARVQRIQQLLNDTGHAVFGVDADGVNTETSSMELKLLGYSSPDELLGRPRAETHWLFPKDREQFLRAIIEGGDHIDDYLTIFKKKNGRDPIWVRGSNHLERDNAGKPHRITGFYRDVTLPHVQEIYQRALLRIRRECDRADAVPAIVTKALRQTTIARAVLFLTNDPLNNVLVIAHADGAPADLHGRYFPFWRPPKDTADCAHLKEDNDFPLPELLGEEAHEELLIRPIADPKGPACYVWIFGAYNPRADSERWSALETFLQEVGIAVRTIIEVQMNRFYQATHRAHRDAARGLSRAEDFLARLLQSLQAEVPFEGGSVFRFDRAFGKLSLAATTGIEGNPKKSTIRYSPGEGLTGTVASKNRIAVVLEVDHDHSSSFPEATASPRRFWAGIPIGAPDGALVGVLRVVNRRLTSDSKLLSPFAPWDIDILKTAATQAELVLSVLGADEERVQMLARVTHEIRRPINSIRANVDVLRQRYHDRERFELRWADIELEAAVLLDLARTLDGLFGSARARYDDDTPKLLRPILLSIVHLLKPELREQGIAPSQIEIPPSGLPSVRMPKTALTQVFWNLIGNALRYAKPGRPRDFRVEIAGRSTERRGLVHVRDWGIGVIEPDRERIFESGVRGSNVTEVQVRGTGLGLAICRQLMRDYGGSISVSNLRDPTEFTLVFPIKRLGVHDSAR